MAYFLSLLLLLQSNNFISKINYFNSKRKSPIVVSTHLNHICRKIGIKLQTSQKDTLIENVYIVYDNDTLKEQLFLNEKYNTIGIWQGPHQFKCEITVIIFSYSSKWKEPPCPKFQTK